MAAGPSAPVPERVDWQGRLGQDFQARHNQQLQNCGCPVQDHNPEGFILPQQVMGQGAFMPPQQFMEQQERYAEEVQRHEAHLAEFQREQQQLREMEQGMEWQTHLAELQQRQENERQLEEQHQNNLDQQLQILQEEAEHVQQVINNNNALRNTPKGCRPYQEPQLRKACKFFQCFSKFWCMLSPRSNKPPCPVSTSSSPTSPPHQLCSSCSKV